MGEKIDLRKEFSLIKLSYTGPREETCFRDAVGYCVTFDVGRPNPLNIGNKLGKINADAEGMAEEFEVSEGMDVKTAKEQIDKAVKESAYAYDDEILQKQIQERSELFERRDSLVNRGEFLKQFANCLKVTKSFGSADIYEEYVRELSQKSTYKEREEVKEPSARQKGIKRIFKKLPEAGMKNAFSHLRDEDVEWFRDVLKNGKLEPEDLKAQGEKLIDMWRHENYPEGQREALAENLMKRYASSVLKDALQNKYYQQTGDIGIFMEKGEKERFEKMSFSELLKEYSPEVLLSTHKGAVMIATKIKEAKTDKKLLAESLVQLKELMSSSRGPVNRSLDVREHLLHALSAQYQKFMPAGDEFRAVFNAMKPNAWEREYMKEVKEKFPAEIAKWEEYAVETEKLFTGKEDVSAAKKRLKEKRENAPKEPDISGTVVADYIARDLRKGYELPKSKEGMDKVVNNAKMEAIRDRENARNKDNSR